MEFSAETRARLERVQQAEITEHLIYRDLSERVGDETTRQTLRDLSNQELAHYEFLKKVTGIAVKPNPFKYRLYYLLARFLGLNFGLGLMERGEESAQDIYEQLQEAVPEAQKLMKEEEKHEEVLLKLMNQEALQYSGSVVLGLNDALVELMGVLAGLTLAFQNTRLVAIAAFITGVAASLSMAGSEYLSTKEEGGRSPLKASVYTGISYVFAVAMLILPYLLFSEIFVCLSISILLALFIVFAFTYYISVAKNLSFRRRFTEMAAISLGVAILNFGIGFLVRKFLNLEV